ncbi:MAG: sigma factor-like helix-turn-helix DNA-binding protein [Candidatus Paceibacterota bacterium]|jgi:hypothetical protein
MISAKISFDSKKVVQTLLGVLPTRAKDIIKKRYGLGNDPKKMTLEAIGTEYGITRERVRQIENFSLHHIRKSKVFEEIDHVFVELKDLMKKYGGIVQEKDFFAHLSADKKVQNHINFFLTLGEEFKRIKEDDDFHHRWSVDPVAEESVHKALNALHKKLSEHDLVSETEITLKFLEEIHATDKEFQDGETVMRWLKLSKRIGRNSLGEWGIAKSPNIKTRGIRDFAYLVIRKNGSPMHFTEVANQINKVFGKKAHVATCHNELIKDNRFVLVGRGLYALKEWGYSKGTVKDIIKTIIEKHGPQTKEDIVKRVMRERYVKENTIMVNLQSSRLFGRDNDGRYVVL